MKKKIVSKKGGGREGVVAPLIFNYACLRPVEDDVEVLVERLPNAVGAGLDAVDHGQPVQAEQGEQDHSRVNGFPGKIRAKKMETCVCKHVGEYAKLSFLVEDTMLPPRSLPPQSPTNQQLSLIGGFSLVGMAAASLKGRGGRPQKAKIQFPSPPPPLFFSTLFPTAELGPPNDVSSRGGKFLLLWRGKR